MNNNNELDDTLKRLLENAQSPLPDGMLNRILEKKSRKKRFGFWLNHVLMVGVLIWLSVFGLQHQRNNAQIDTSANNFTAKSIVLNQNKSSQPIKTGTQSKINNPTKNEAIEVPQIFENKINNLRPRSASVMRNNRVLNEEMTKKLIVKDKNDGSGKDLEITVNNSSKDMVESTAAVVDENSSIEENQVENLNKTKPINQVAIEPEAMKKDTQLVVNSKPKVKPIRKPLTPEFQLALGYTHQKLSTQFTNVDLNYTNRNYEPLIKSAIRPGYGFQLDMGLRYPIFPNFFTAVGFNFKYSSSTTTFKTAITEVPVVDTDQRIVGYLDLPDSGIVQINAEFRSEMRQVSIPIQLGYQFDIYNQVELNVMMGINPLFTYYNKMALPNTVNLEDIAIRSLKSQFALPVSTSLGIYKRMSRGKVGILVSASPLKSKMAEIQNVGFVRSTSVGLALQWIIKF